MSRDLGDKFNDGYKWAMRKFKHIHTITTVLFIWTIFAYDGRSARDMNQFLTICGVIWFLILIFVLLIVPAIRKAFRGAKSASSTVADGIKNTINEKKLREEQLKYKEKLRKMAIASLQTKREREKEKKWIRELEKDRRERAELENEQARLSRTEKLTDFSLNEYLDDFIKRLGVADLNGLPLPSRERMTELYSAIEAYFENRGMVAPDKVKSIGEDASRLDKVETLMRLYQEKRAQTEREFEEEKIDEPTRKKWLDMWDEMEEKDRREILLADIEDD